MKEYFVLWTYIGNYSDSVIVVQAESPKDAVKRATHYFSDDFRERGRVYVFDKKPVLIDNPSPRERSLSDEPCN